MTEFSRIMELRNKLDSAEDISRLDEALDSLGNAFKALLQMTKHFMQGTTPEKLDLVKADAATKTLRELGKGRGYSLPEFNSDKDLCDFIVKFGSELIRG